MASPRRFVPINAVLALLSEHNEWPPALARTGFRLVGLEIPTTTPLGSTALDVVCHRPTDDYLLVAECKSGGNIDVDQARKLIRLDASGISRTASVTLASGMRPRLEVIYVCLDEHADRIEGALIGSGLAFPILAIGSTHLRNLQTPCRDAAMSATFANRIPIPGPPPRIVRFDRDSTLEEMLPVVHAELVAGLSHRRDLMTIRMLTERCVPEYPYLGRGTQGRLKKLVDSAALRLCQAHREVFEYRPRSEGHDEAAVGLLRSPEETDLRGRTQQYQALRRQPAKARQRRPEIPGQLDLLAQEAEQLDDRDEANEENG